MNFHKRLRQENGCPGRLVAKAVSLHIISVLTVISHMIAFWISTYEAMFPGPDAMMNVVTTVAQIIAGLYGITLAGYTFFLSRIDALTSNDSTLDYVTVSMKNRFKHLIWFISSKVAMSMLVSIVLMYWTVPDGESTSFLYRLICNEFILFAIFSIGLILYYSILVIDPNCIEKEAAKLKRKMNGRSFVPASAAEFLSLYNGIERCCSAMLPEHVLRQLCENKGKRFNLMLELLEAENLLPKRTIRELILIRRYYECTVNCSPLSVSQDMCVLAGNMLALLEQLELPAEKSH